MAMGTPGRLLALGFAGGIVAGAWLLMLPGITRAAAAPLSASDALFMATSAICVTGLGVRDLLDFSGFGQAMLLLLIQVGGIGIVTLSKLTLLRASRQLGLGERDLFDASFGRLRYVSPRQVLSSTIAYTLVCECFGCALLAPSFIARHGVADGLWAAAFHSVSAFCNAGFGLWPDNLIAYQDDLWVNLVVMVLIVAGGLGFVVIGDTLSWLHRRRTVPNARLSLHSKVVLLTTGCLIAGGCLIFLCLESLNPTGPMAGDPLRALFLSVTARTAGYNTVAIGELCSPTLLVLILLMFIGGSPGSTAGGVKTTALAVLVATVRARARGRPETEILDRSVSAGAVGRALGAVAMMVAVVMVGTVLLIITESGIGPHSAQRAHFLDHLFEVVSAVSTTGLSTGITPRLSDPGRAVIELCMFVGRLGPLLMAATLFAHTRSADYRLPREDLIIG
ncbi:MAG: hypothetical protein H0W72_05285 [Planctomycetes bacterium]|nr:hypothetical protein [Planctomycetota bacterium]